MSEVNPSITDPDYMANRIYEKQEFLELIRILRRFGHIGAVPEARLKLVAELLK